jgi:zinc protease
MNPGGVSRACAVLAALLLLAGAAAPAPRAEVARATLANGMRVVVVRNTLAPVVSTSLNYLVGANETPPGFPGTAHAVEHVMFRGSPGLSADQLADLGSIMGGEFNADTRQTVTQYLYTVPAEDLEVVLNIEALRMRSVLAAEDDWKGERGAIEQEVAQDLSNPQYNLYTRLRTAVFAGTPYAHDALGTRESFEKTTGAMLAQFHDRWYAPNNAILVVVGDVDPAAALAQVRRLFEPIASKPLPERPAVAPAPVAPQSFSLDSDLAYGLQVIALRFPGLDAADFAAAEVLVDVLKSRRGELYGLVPAGEALATDFSFEPLPQAGLAYALAAFPAGGDAKALEARIRAVLAKIAKDGVPADLVAAAKLQERRDAELQRNSIAGLATVWAEAVAVYGLESPDDDLARIERVTVEDVNRVAREYLDLDHAVSAVMTPVASGKAVASQGFGGKEKLAPGEIRPVPLPDWAAPLERLAVPASSVHPVVTRLPNGITLMVQPEQVSGAVSVYGHVENRPELQVPKGREGLAEVMEQLFPYGSRRLDRVALQRALDAIGADASAGTDFSLQVLAEHFDRGMGLLADNMLRPAFPAAAFGVVRRQVADSVAGQLATPAYLGRMALRGALFPRGDPTLREPTPETVRKLSLADVRAYYASVFRPDLTTIVVIGRITPARARAVVEKYFGAWKAAGPAPRTTLPRVPLNRAAVRAVPDASRVQDRVILGQTLGLTRPHPDAYALELGNAVLGGAFYSTRLTRDLRKEAGLVYYVQSSLQFGRTRALYLVDYACDPQNVAKVHDIVAGELVQMQKTPVTDGELARAKALLLRRLPLEEASVDGIAHGLIERRTLRLPLDEPTLAARRYAALGAADVQAAFVKWIRPGDFVRVSEGPEPR